MSEFLCHDVLSIVATCGSVLDVMRLRQVSRSMRKAALAARPEVPTVEQLAATEEAWTVVKVENAYPGPDWFQNKGYQDAFEEFSNLTADALPMGGGDTYIADIPAELASLLVARHELDDPQPAIRLAGKVLGHCFLQPVGKAKAKAQRTNHIR